MHRKLKLNMVIYQVMTLETQPYRKLKVETYKQSDRAALKHIRKSTQGAVSHMMLFGQLPKAKLKTRLI